VNGPSASTGFILALHCHLRFVSDKASFSTAFSKRGLIAEHGVGWILSRLVGLLNALDLLNSSRVIGANASGHCIPGTIPRHTQDNNSVKKKETGYFLRYR
jgi:enoyl-CoA hydratase/carnithine racemase